MMIKLTLQHERGFHNFLRKAHELSQKGISNEQQKIITFMQQIIRILIGNLRFTIYFTYSLNCSYIEVHKSMYMNQIRYLT